MGILECGVRNFNREWTRIFANGELGFGNSECGIRNEEGLRLKSGLLGGDLDDGDEVGGAADVVEFMGGGGGEVDFAVVPLLGVDVFVDEGEVVVGGGEEEGVELDEARGGGGCFGGLGRGEDGVGFGGAGGEERGGEGEDRGGPEVGTRGNVGESQVVIHSDLLRVRGEGSRREGGEAECGMGNEEG